MKKSVGWFVSFLMIFSVLSFAHLALADEGSDDSDSSGSSGSSGTSTGSSDNSGSSEDGSSEGPRTTEGNDGELKQEIEIKEKITDDQGIEREIEITVKTENKSDGTFKRVVKVENSEVESELEIKEESGNNKTKIKVKLSNGSEQEIKVMPDRASQVAIEQLRSHNLTIVLKEVGNANATKAVFVANTTKNGKFLGIFKIAAKVQAEIDAGNGNVKVIKPWWAFLVSGLDDVSNSPGNSTENNETSSTPQNNITVGNSSSGNLSESNSSA